MINHLMQKFSAWKKDRFFKKQPTDIQNFLRKYGTNLAHYEFKSKDKNEQIEFLQLYTKYLEVNISFEKTALTEHCPQLDSPVIALYTKKGTIYYVFFLKEDGRVAQIGKDLDGNESYGLLNISFEINLN